MFAHVQRSGSLTLFVADRFRASVATSTKRGLVAWPTEFVSDFAAHLQLDAMAQAATDGRQTRRGASSD